MARIEGEAARMGLLVEDLLMLARLDAQRPLERTPVDLLAVGLATPSTTRGPSRPDRRIALEVLGGPGAGRGPRRRGAAASGARQPGRQRADPHTAGTADVTVRGRHRRPDALLEVADTGPGLDAGGRRAGVRAVLPGRRLAEPGSGGSGLGLSIVAALVSAHGGTVTVESAEGEGAVFRVLLPRIERQV